MTSASEEVPAVVVRLREALGEVAATFGFEHSDTMRSWDSRREVNGWSVIYHAEPSTYPNAGNAFGYAGTPSCLDLWLNLEMAPDGAELTRVDVKLEGDDLHAWLMEEGSTEMASALRSRPIDVVLIERALSETAPTFMGRVLDDAR